METELIQINGRFFVYDEESSSMIETTEDGGPIPEPEREYDDA